MNTGSIDAVLEVRLRHARESRCSSVGHVGTMAALRLRRSCVEIGVFTASLPHPGTRGVLLPAVLYETARVRCGRSLRRALKTGRHSIRFLHRGG